MNCARKPHNLRRTMGNSVSTAAVKSLEGKDLFDMSDAELYTLLHMHAWSKYEIHQVVKSLKPLDSPKSRFYASDDTPETDLAVRLNRLSSELATLRFQTVPSVLKEPVFWECVFEILRERLVEHNAKFETKTTGALQSNGYQPSNTDTLVKSLQAQLAVKEQTIAELQSQVENLQIALQKTPIHHVGKWMMDKDSQEFIQYPEEVKENMRKEKQRRLLQVQQDMKFILDSDSIEHSNGHWTCCGDTEYHSSCPKTDR
jgi:hypothetical protein